MDDDQLQMLQREFMCIQQQKTNPLAQRTVAQIMVKLHHEGFRFYSTTDGNEYLTPQRLDSQIITLILERGHINIGILPQILNIGLDTIQGRILKILTKHSSQSTCIQNKSINNAKIFRHNTLLLSQKYLISIIQKIKQTLIIEGKVNLQRIALQNEFNIKFTQKFIKENIGLLNAELLNNQLITRQYNLMKKVKLLGYLRAITNPMSFQNILKMSKLSENDDNRTIQGLIQQIITEKKLKGKYQNSYYIPDSFVLNQKQRILQFFNNNGFIDFQMLQKQFLVSKPEEWLKKNLSQAKQFSGKYIIFEEVCILTQKLEQFAHHIVQSLNQEGFLQISHVLPFNLEEKELQKFLNQFCHLTEYFLHQGYCYSQKWLSKVMQQFKQKVFKSIFINQTNDSKKKKGAKKETKAKLIQQDQLIQKLYNQGLAQYSVAQNIAPVLVPILTKKLEQQKKKYQKQLGQNRGILNNSFLKFKSCNTIMRNIDGLQRILNIIDKQKKKSNGSWIDKDFGPNQIDQKGIYSILYFDAILPKGWPTLQQNLKWQSVSIKKEKQIQLNLISSNSLFIQILQIIEVFNNNYAKNLLDFPLMQQKQIQKKNNQSPFTFSFYRNQKDKRYVIVDDKLPFINDKLIGSSGIYGYVQKAYAKFRYCYKGILNLSVKTLLLQITGRQPNHLTSDKTNQKQIIETILQNLKQNRLIICIGQGQSGKKSQIKTQQEDTIIQIKSMKPYLCIQSSQINGKSYVQILNPQNGVQIKNNQGQKINLKYLVKAFKNFYIL